MAANQPPPVRPWFRIGSMARPAPAPTPAPAPEPAPEAQPRPALPQPAFTAPLRPPITAQPQPQEPTPLPPPSIAAASPPPPAAEVAPPPPAVLPPPPPAATSSSVPTSPISKTVAPSSSLPTSPAPKKSPSKTVLPMSSYSVPSSPIPKAAPSSSVPTSPAAPKAAAPSSSAQTSTIKTTTTTTVTTSRGPIPGPSPKIIKAPSAKTPPQSPTIKPQAPPPSPLTLPPSHFKSDAAEPEPKIPLVAEQKNVLVQKTIEKPKTSTFNGDSQSDVRKPSIAHNGKNEAIKDVESKDKVIQKKFSDSEDGGVRVITLAGENKGAFMELGPSHKKHNNFEGNPHSLQQRNNPTGRKIGETESSSSDEEKKKTKEKGHNTMAMSSPPMSAFMNSNVQSVNNSILHNCSCTHHDPGVHLSLSRKPTGGFGIHLKDNTKGQQS